MAENRKKLLTIAGSDSGGGAGIQADLKTFSALGCYGMSVITAITAQNTLGVRGVWALSSQAVALQLEAVLQDLGADAIKIGMLGEAHIVKEVAAILKKESHTKIVLDPVMVAKSGDKLLSEEAIEVLKEELLPLAIVVTPNIPEAEVLTGMKIGSKEDMEKAASAILSKGSRAVLVKGGHLPGGPADDCLLLQGGAPLWYATKQVKTKNTHGTGCTFSSAIAAFLGRGLPLEVAVREAKGYLQKAIEAGSSLSLGQGQGPVEHFFAWSNISTFK